VPVLIDRASLSRTVDAVNASYFDGRPPAAAERSRVASWIAARQGQPGSYAETFAGFPAERAKGIVLFTGERITSASARHILGEESSRALRLLRIRDSVVTRALDAADAGLMRCLARAIFFHAAKVLNPQTRVRHLESIDGMPRVGRTAFVPVRLSPGPLYGTRFGSSAHGGSRLARTLRDLWARVAAAGLKVRGSWWMAWLLGIFIALATGCRTWKAACVAIGFPPLRTIKAVSALRPSPELCPR